MVYDLSLVILIRQIHHKCRLKVLSMSVCDSPDPSQAECEHSHTGTEPEELSHENWATFISSSHLCNNVAQLIRLKVAVF